MKYRIIPVTAFQQNCSLLCCEKTSRAALVDPGGDLDLLDAAIVEEKVELESVLVTHAHLDHVGAVADVAEKYDVPIIGPHQADDFWISSLTMQSEILGLPVARKFTPQRWLSQNDLVKVGDMSLEVRHCPGHTPGHVVFYSSEDSLVIVGDVLFDGSIGRTDFPQSDHQVLLNSIQEQLLTLPDDTRFIPGHGAMSTIGEQKKNNPFLV